jgi:hypothetical protein
LGIQPSLIYLWVKQVLDQAERAFLNQPGGKRRERCIRGVGMRLRRSGVGWGGGRAEAEGGSVPGGEGAVGGLLDVVETLAEIDDVGVATTTLDDRVRQVAGQPVQIDGAEGDRLDIVAGSAGLELIAHCGSEVPLEQRGALLRQQFESNRIAGHGRSPGWRQDGQAAARRRSARRSRAR